MYILFIFKRSLSYLLIQTTFVYFSDYVLLNNADRKVIFKVHNLFWVKLGPWTFDAKIQSLSLKQEPIMLCLLKQTSHTMTLGLVVG